jgi:hypothetical protein
MATNGEANITILDGGTAVVVPAASVQLVIGCCSAGTVGTIVATQNVNTLVTNCGYGPGVEAAAMACAAGGTVVFIKATNNAAGTATAVTFAGTGTSVLTVTGAPLDDANVKFKFITGGTRGVTGITFQVSMDAGRSFGPVFSLGTAVSWTSPLDAAGRNPIGWTLNFAAGTIVALDTAIFSTCAPSWNDAGIQAALNTFQASQYASSGVGEIHVVGGITSAAGQSSGAAGADATAIGGYLETLRAGFIYNRVILSGRDSLTPVAWGGAGETEAVWYAAVALDYVAVSQRRVCASAGYYNMSGAVLQPAAGLPRYRRPGAWALACREVVIPPQRHAGRVKDGALSQIVVDPANDPGDGFVYHDERINSTLDGARFTSFRTRVGKPGFFVVNPNLMSGTGSVFTILPLGLVMDVACAIVHQIGQSEVNDDIRLNASGTIFENNARTIETEITNALTSQMPPASMSSNPIVSVDRTNNVRTTSNVNIAVTIYSRGYILQETITIGFG